MKKLLALLLTLVLGLCACQPEGEDPTIGPCEPNISAQPTAPASVSPEQTPAPSNAPATLQPVAEPDNARYFFAQSCFLGSWDDGTWHSAADGGFTLGQLFNRDYISWLGEKAGAVRFIADNGPGGFENAGQVREALKPFGVLEGGDFIMALPGALTGDAAAQDVPTYGFFAHFDGQSHYLISNAPVTPADLRADEGGGPDLDALLSEVTGTGVKLDPDRVTWEVLYCDVDGDGAAEQLALIRSAASDDGELLIREGDDIFYALLLTDDGQTDLVALEYAEYTDNLVEHFSPGQPIAADLDGDGTCEIILQYRGWEWGHYSVYDLEDGAWTEVLRAEYGT